MLRSIFLFVGMTGLGHYSSRLPPRRLRPRLAICLAGKLDKYRCGFQILTQAKLFACFIPPSLRSVAITERSSNLF